MIYLLTFVVLTILLYWFYWIGKLTFGECGEVFDFIDILGYIAGGLLVTACVLGVLFLLVILIYSILDIWL